MLLVVRWPWQRNRTMASTEIAAPEKVMMGQLAQGHYLGTNHGLGNAIDILLGKSSPLRDGTPSKSMSTRSEWCSVLCVLIG